MLFFFGYSLPAPPFPPGAPDCVPASPCRKAGAGAMSACGNRFSSAPAGRPRCPATSPPCFARHIIPRIAPYEKIFCRKIPPVLRTSPLHAFGIKGGTAICHAGAPPSCNKRKIPLRRQKITAAQTFALPFCLLLMSQKLCCLPARSNTFFYPPCPAVPLHAFGIKGGTAACHADAPPARLISPLSVLRTSPPL